MAELLAIFTIRRDEKSEIKGEKVMIDYFGQCKVQEESLPSVPSEVQERERQYRALVNSGILKNNSQMMRNEYMRCLSYSYRFVSWKALSDHPTRRAKVWEGYRMTESEGHVRTKALIQFLREGKRTGNGVVIFVQREFLAELCLKVRSRNKL